MSLFRNSRSTGARTRGRSAWSRRAAVATVAGLSLVVTSCSGSRAGDDAADAESCLDTSGDSVKIGLINSLSGTMAISETNVNESLKMAVEEINDDGGVLGKELEIKEEDGASEPATFAERSQRLIQQECVAAVFGGWTSASRKAMLPVFEGNNSLLFYPVQYEGLEASDNIFYSGATTNQQIIPALDYPTGWKAWSPLVGCVGQTRSPKCCLIICGTPPRRGTGSPPRWRCWKGPCPL